jgi:hypothetical protein
VKLEHSCKQSALGRIRTLSDSPTPLAHSWTDLSLWDVFLSAFTGGEKRGDERRWLAARGQQTSRCGELTGSLTGVRQPIGTDALTVLLANEYRPVGYGAGPLLSIGKNTLLHLANWSARQVAGRLIGQ